MSEPIVFISHFKVKEGKLDGLKQRFREVTKLLDAEKPRTLVFLAYVEEYGTQVTFVHVFADAEARTSTCKELRRGRGRRTSSSSLKDSRSTVLPATECWK